MALGGWEEGPPWPPVKTWEKRQERVGDKKREGEERAMTGALEMSWSSSEEEEE